MSWGKTAPSFRTRLVAIVVMVLAVGFITTSAISFNVSRESLRETIVVNELPLTSNNIYSDIQVDLLRPVFVSSLMANDTFLKDWVLGGEQDESRIRRYLDEIRLKYGAFTSFFVSERTRNYYHFTGVTQVVDEADPRDAWFFRVRAMEMPYEINVDHNAEQGDTLTIFINYRVLDENGHFLGAAGVGLQLDTVARILTQYSQNYRRTIYFVDGAGRITLRSEGARITVDNIHQAEGMGEVADRILGVDHLSLSYRSGDETVLLSSRYIPELKWWVLVEQKEAQVTTELRQSLLVNFLVSLVVIGLTILMVVYTVNHFQARLEMLATTDKLTGIGNRQVFDISLEQSLKVMQRYGEPFSVFLFDIDRFKDINDTYGHLEGDRVLRMVALLGRESLRESDLICRWGGDEFIVIARQCRLEDGRRVADKLQRSIESTPLLRDGKAVTITVGITESRPGEDADAVLARVDQAYYAAKRTARGQEETVAEPG